MDANKLAKQLGPRWNAVCPGVIERLPRVIKTCGCGETYTLAEFRALKCLGIQPMDDGDMPVAYEYHDCSCGSTLAIGLDRAGRYYDESEVDNETL